MNHKITTISVNYESGRSAGLRHVCECGWSSVMYHFDDIDRKKQAGIEKSKHEKKFVKLHVRKLKEIVDDSIYNYPLLYKACDYESSRLLVLNQLFLTIGTGYEWHKNGYLCYLDSKKTKFEKLPKNYFEYKLFYACGKIINEVNFPKFAYKVKHDYEDYDFTFEADSLEHAQKIIGNDEIFVHELRNEYFHPYPICEYSNITKIGSFVQDDWLAGAVEITKATLNFYQTASYYWDQPYDRSQHSYHPRSTYNSLKNMFNDPEKMKNFQSTRPNETLENYSQRVWENFREKQIDIVTQILNTWDK